MTALSYALAAGIALAFVRETWAWRLEQIVLLLIAAWGLVAGRVRVQFSTVLAVLLALVAWPALQLALHRTGYEWATSNVALMWLSWLAAFLLTAALAQQDHLDWIAGVGTAIAFIALMQRHTATDGKIYWLFDSGYNLGLMGPFVYENQYAAFIQLVLPAALVLAFATGRVSIGWAAASALMIVSVVASGSRAGSILVFAETLVVVMLLRVGKKAGALAALVTVFALITGWQLLADKLLRDKPYEDRWMLTQSTWDMIRERPGLGFGAGTWPRVHPAYAQFDDGLFDNHAHNDWAEWAAEGGVPYAVLMLAFGLVIAPRAWRTIWGIGLLTVLLHCWVDYHFHERPAFGAFYFALAGAVWRVGQLYRPKTATPSPPEPSH